MDVRQNAAFLLPLAWIAGWIIASIVYRRFHGKPVLFFGVRDVTFVERRVSGWAHQPRWRQFGGARNCLVVAIINGRLIVRPSFPFNLMFLPEIYGLEHDVALADVVRATRERYLFFWTRVRLALRCADGQTREISLLMRRSTELLAHLRLGIQRAHTLETETARLSQLS